MLGEYEHELEAARRARRLFPNWLLIERGALVALGRTDEVLALLDEDQRLGPAWSVARELFLHDHLEALSQVLDRGIMRYQAWLSTQPTDTTSIRIEFHIRGLAEMLVLDGRVDEARVLLERAVEERGDSGFRRRLIGTLGVIAGMQGDRKRALEIYQDLAAQQWTSPWSRTKWQAQIAASLGEIDEATALLREAVGEGLSVFATIHYRESPLFFRALRDNPSFQELMRPKG